MVEAEQLTKIPRIQHVDGRRGLYLILTDKMIREMPVVSMIHHLFSKIKLHASLENCTIFSNFALIVRLLPSLDVLLPADLNLYPRPPLSSTILTTFHATRFYSCENFGMSFPFA